MLASARAANPLVVRGMPAELEGVVGQRVLPIERVGKFLTLDLDRDQIAINPMITGQFQLAPDPATRAPSGVAIVLAFGMRDRGAPAYAARWTIGAS